MRSFLFALVMFSSLSAQSFSTSDFTENNISKPDNDSVFSDTAIENSTALPIKKDSDTLIAKSDLSSVKKQDIIDSNNIVLKGYYAGIGAGWSLGSLDAVKLWQYTLPDSLYDLHLNDPFLVRLPDTKSADSVLHAGDTAHLHFSIKDKPSIYNMTFPITFSFTNFREFDRFTTSITLAFFSKNQKSSIYLLNDSLNRRVDLKQNFLFYTISLNLLYAKKIPPIYFSVDGVNRTDFFLGLTLTPLTRLKTTNSIKRYSNDPRTIGIEDTIRSRLITTDSYGISSSIRTGITTIKQLSTGALEIGLNYSLTWNGYFFHNGERIKRGALYSSDSDANKPLSFFSNRFEINISLLRHVGKFK